MGKVTLLLMLEVLVCISALGDGLVLSPVERVLCGESFGVWGVVLGDDVLVSGEELAYRWEVVRGAEVRGEGLGEWLGCAETGDMPLELACGDLAPVELRLEVTDGEGVALSGHLALEVHSRETLGFREALRVRKRLGVIEGLHWLQLHQQKDGSWGEPSSWHQDVWEITQGFYRFHNEIASTGMALWAYGVHGFALQPGARGDHSFAGTVRRALAYLGESCQFEAVRPSDSCADLASVDVNGNGRRVRFSTEWFVDNYTTPMGLSGMISAGYPDYEVRTSEGLVSLRDLAGDARDFMVYQLGEPGNDGWPYSSREPYAGFDLSIAGWNFLALSLCGEWLPSLPFECSKRIKTFLQRRFSLRERRYVYKVMELFHPSPGSISITASGILGGRLLLEQHLGPSLETLQVALVDYDSFESIDFDVLLGDVESWVVPDVFYWLRDSDFKGAGYELWNACKALMVCGVTRLRMDDGELYDWRYGNGKQKGTWEKVLDLQDDEGSWDSSSMKWLYYYQHELHHSLMVLSLGEHVVRPLSPDVLELEAVCQVPEVVAETSDWPEGVVGSQGSDGLWTYRLSRVVEGNSELDLSWSYASSGGVPGVRELIQAGGQVSWRDCRGASGSIALDELWLEREASGYGLQVAWGEERRAWHELEVQIVSTLPPSEHQAFFSVGKGRQGEIALFESADKLNCWLGVELLGEERADAFQWISRSHGSQRHWRRLGPECRGERGRCFGVSLEQPLDRTVRGILHYLNSPFRLMLTVESLRGEDVLIWDRELKQEDFGRVQELSVPVEGLPVGQYACHGWILRGDDVVAEGMDTLEVVADTHRAFSNELLVSNPVRWGEAAKLRSRVWALDGMGGIAGKVELWRDEEPVEWRWSLDKASLQAQQERTFYVDSEQIGAGEHVFHQRVTLEDGRKLTASNILKVLPIKEVRGNGMFEEEAYVITEDADGVTVFVQLTGGLLPDDVTVTAVDECLEGVELGALHAVEKTEDGEETWGRLKLLRGTGAGQQQGMLALLTQEQGRLLDVTTVAVKEKQPVSDTLDEDESPETTEPETTVPPEDPVATEPETTDPTEEPVATEPETTDPTEEPVLTEPEGTDPPEDPVATEPETTDPTEEPVPTEPETTVPTEEPVATEPEGTDPPEEPVPTEPETTDPGEESKPGDSGDADTGKSDDVRPDEESKDVSRVDPGEASGGVGKPGERGTGGGQGGVVWLKDRQFIRDFPENGIRGQRHGVQESSPVRRSRQADKVRKDRKRTPPPATSRRVEWIVGDKAFTGEVRGRFITPKAGKVSGEVLWRRMVLWMSGRTAAFKSLFPELVDLVEREWRRGRGETGGLGEGVP